MITPKQDNWTLLLYWLLRKRVVEFLFTEIEKPINYPMARIGPVKINPEKLETEEGREVLSRLNNKLAMLISSTYPSVNLIIGDLGNKTDARLAAFLPEKLSRMLGKEEIDYILMGSARDMDEEIKLLELKEINIILIRAFIGFEENHFSYNQIKQLSKLGYQVERVFCLLKNPALDSFFKETQTKVCSLIDWNELIRLASNEFYTENTTDEILRFLKAPDFWINGTRQNHKLLSALIV